MRNFLLNVYNSSVVSLTTSGDGKPGAVAGGLDFDVAAFILGMFVGAIITLSIIGIVKYVKFIIKDNKEMEERLNSQRDK